MTPSKYPVKIVQVFRVEREITVEVTAKDHDSAVELIAAAGVHVPEFEDYRWSDGWDLQNEVVSKAPLPEKQKFAPLPPEQVSPLSAEDSVNRLMKGKPELVPYIVRNNEYDLKYDVKLNNAGVHKDVIRLAQKIATATERYVIKQFEKALSARKTEDGGA